MQIRARVQLLAAAKPLKPVGALMMAHFPTPAVKKARPMKYCALLAFTLALAATQGAMAETVRLLGDYRDWSAYASTDASNQVCFAMTKPTSVEPQPNGYTQAQIYVAHRPAENVTNEFNLVAGFDFAPDSKATVSIGGQSFALFTQKDAAWLDDASQSANLAGAIRAGSTLVIEGTSAAGIKIKETFSLSGATAASQAIAGEC
ncbi:invasion associated locus B family protein [Devosia algicola]|uniref:Invasion associated locus B family protein n=1 Tax=Devosia algicola TaxID=3026418 RepID=A0ABY7YL75_9HYPH|nr:invasion associated locus B family protein [Devosia algicola]WDR01725.1 invasion associated locus B family protein [Devosia algicola]